jgi:hypothetical protein
MMLPWFNQKAGYFAMRNDNRVLIVLDTKARFPSIFG